MIKIYIYSIQWDSDPSMSQLVDPDPYHGRKPKLNSDPDPGQLQEPNSILKQ